MPTLESCLQAEAQGDLVPWSSKVLAAQRFGRSLATVVRFFILIYCRPVISVTAT